MNFWICLLIGAIIGGIVVGIMLSQLHSVAPNNRAADYVVRDSFQVTFQDESYLGNKVDRTPRAQQPPLQQHPQ